MGLIENILSTRTPRMEFIVFELLEIDIKKQQADSNYKPKVMKTIDLAVIPESLQYRLQSRDSVSQTEKDVYVQRFEMAPEKVTFSGTFGDDKRMVGIEWLDGWQRLQQFEQFIVRNSKKSEEGKVYAVNYYDFLFQRFGAINIDSWALTANARNNTNLINYSLDFTIVGELITTTTKLPILSNLMLGMVDRVFNAGLMANIMVTGVDYEAVALDIASGLDGALTIISALVTPSNLVNIGKITLKKGAF